MWRCAGALVVATGLVATLAAAPPEQRTRRFEGELTKVSGDSISVRPVKRGDARGGIEWTVAVDEKTKVVRTVSVGDRNRRRYRTEAARRSDLEAGQHVRVKADAERAEEINILPPPDAQG